RAGERFFRAEASRPRAEEGLIRAEGRSILSRERRIRAGPSASWEVDAPEEGLGQLPVPALNPNAHRQLPLPAHVREVNGNDFALVNETSALPIDGDFLNDV